MPAGSITSNANYPSDGGWRTIQKPGNANAQLHLSGTFDSATVQVQFLADGDTSVGSSGWLSISGGAYTAADDDVINLPNARYVRLNVSGGGASMAIDYDIY